MQRTTYESSDEPQLQADTPVTLHEQLTNWLRGEIERVGPGARLPTEAELTSRFDVSRSTVRKAIQTLEEENLVIRRHGKGTFVASRKPLHRLDEAVFVRSFAAAGLEPKATLVDFEWRSDDLGVRVSPTGDRYLFIRRLYQLDDETHSVVDARLPEWIGTRIQRKDIEHHPTYYVLEHSVGEIPYKADLRVMCALLDGDIRDLLSIEPTTYVPILRRLTVNQGRLPLEDMVAHINPELFEMRAQSVIRGPTHADFFGRSEMETN